MLQKLSEGLDIHLGAEARCVNQLYHNTQNQKQQEQHEQHEHVEYVESANSEVKSIEHLEDEVSVLTTTEKYRGAEDGDCTDFSVKLLSLEPQSQVRR